MTMNIALEFTYNTDIISVPDEIAVKINKLQQSFDKWLYNKDNDHGNWIIRNGRKVAVSFDTETFIEYLNKFYLNDSDEKAIIVQKSATEIPTKIPTLFF